MPTLPPKIKSLLPQTVDLGSSERATGFVFFGKGGEVATNRLHG
ncbi:hypothetical protein [Mesorhizobium sp. M0578]